VKKKKEAKRKNSRYGKFQLIKLALLTLSAILRMRAIATTCFGFLKVPTNACFSRLSLS
jgi:hypothetical protein